MTTTTTPYTTTTSHTAEPDWNAVVERALKGDRVEYARLARRVTGHLAHWRAYDFSADWDDIVQEVLLSVLGAHEEGRLDPPGAAAAYLRKATRFKFIDRIRRQQRWRSDGDPQDLEQGAHWPPAKSLEKDATDLRLSLDAALATLPETERAAIVEIHIHGRTYVEAAEATGIGRAALERGVKMGLARMRKALDGPNN